MIDEVGPVGADELPIFQKGVGFVLGRETAKGVLEMAGGNVLSDTEAAKETEDHTGKVTEPAGLPIKS